MKETKFSDKMRNERTAVYLPELFEELDKHTDIETRKNIIIDYRDNKNGNLLREYLQSLYHPKVILDLPDSIPPYDNSQYIDYDMAPLRLEKALARLGYFFKGHSNYIAGKIKREHVFIQTLESLHKKDSELYESILLKQFPIFRYNSLSLSLFMYSVPEYFTNIDKNYITEVLKNEKKLKPKLKSTETKDG